MWGSMDFSYRSMLRKLLLVAFTFVRVSGYTMCLFAMRWQVDRAGAAMQHKARVEISNIDVCLVPSMVVALQVSSMLSFGNGAWTTAFGSPCLDTQPRLPVGMHTVRVALPMLFLARSHDANMA
jgi:hypothetical protein